VCALSLAQATRARACEAGRRHDDGRALAGQHLELAPLCDASLVDMSGEDQLGAGRGQLLEHTATPRKRPLPRAPGRVGELMVKADDP